MLSRPQQTGYSQSRSRPSKPVRSRSATAELTRACRLACVLLQDEKWVDLVQPPSERMRRSVWPRLACSSRRATKAAMLPYTVRPAAVCESW